MKTLKTWAAAAAMLALTGAAQAALINRGGGMIYDTTRDITWLADMNYANTSGHTGTGVFIDPFDVTRTSMNWDAATAWANNLVYGGFSDWRLPTLDPADTSCTGGGVGQGFNCTGGELSGLFVTDLGSKPNESVLNPVGDTAVQIANLALFSNVQPGGYWSGTEYALGSGSAWAFATGGANGGIQTFAGKFNFLSAVAARPGDVPAAVPEPQTLALALLALGAAVVARRRRPR